MQAITPQDYSATITELAQEVIATLVSDNVDREDVVLELVEDHPWVIYNFYYMQILQHSQNEDYGWESGIVDLDPTNFWETMQHTAIWALYADVMDMVEALEG